MIAVIKKYMDKDIIKDDKFNADKQAKDALLNKLVLLLDDNSNMSSGEIRKYILDIIDYK